MKRFLPRSARVASLAFSVSMCSEYTISFQSVFNNCIHTSRYESPTVWPMVTEANTTCLRERYRIMEKRMANRGENEQMSSLKAVGLIYNSWMAHIFVFAQALYWNSCLKRIGIIMLPQNPLPFDYIISTWHHNAPNLICFRVKHAGISCSETVEWSSHSARLVAGVPLFLFKGSSLGWGLGESFRTPF